MQTGAERRMNDRRIQSLDDLSKFIFAPAFVVSLWPAILCMLLFCPDARASAPPGARNVLLFFHFPAPVADPAYVNQIESIVRARTSGPVNFFVEYMEATRADDQDYQRNIIASLRNTYAERKLDLIMLSGFQTLDLFVRHRSELFPGVPIVYFSVESRKIAGQTWPGITGVTETQDVESVLDLALRLKPDTENIAIVTGKSVEETFWLKQLHAAILHRQKKLKEFDLIDIPTDQIFTRVNQLPEQTIVFFELVPRGSENPAIQVQDVLEEVGQHLPTFCVFPYSCVGHGAVAGVESSGRDEVITLAGTLAARVLSGEPADSIPVVHPTGTQILADWKMLHRWHIPESALPKDTRFYNREPTLWERDRKYFISALALIVAQAFLIIALLWQRARKRRAEAVVRESESRFRVMADTTPSLVWMCDTRGRITYSNESRLAFVGVDWDGAESPTWTKYVHPDDLKNVLDTVSVALKSRQRFSMEYRFRRSDGVYRWLLDVAAPRVNGDGSFAGFIGSGTDTTDQKLAQLALERVSGQLVEAQEKERSRIARDLHDDICQRLALLAMEISQANQNIDGTSEKTKQRLQDIRQHCCDIAVDVQSLSHQLHSSKLEYLGIGAAIRGFCEELSKQHNVEIRFTESNVPGNLRKDIALCLFRVTQEALHNAVKYSGTSIYTVELHGMGQALELVVSDSGAGFDVEAAKSSRGFGLSSMQERLHLVHGALSIESRPGAGTKVLAVVPLTTESEMNMPEKHAVSSMRS
jgi:PAS domain S-box-containing protein